MSTHRPLVPRVMVNHASSSGWIVLLGLVLLGLIAGQAAAQQAEAPAAKKPEAAKEKTERGRFVSYQDGLLTIEANSGEKLSMSVTAKAKTLVWSDSENSFQPAETDKVLRQAKANDWLQVRSTSNDLTIRIGSRKGKTVGTFVSYKDDRLMLLGKNLGESFVKKYGNNVHFNKFRTDVPVYESIDGGEYKLIGTPQKVLPEIKEGTIVTVHGEGDDNIVLIQLGVPKQE